MVSTEESLPGLPGVDIQAGLDVTRNNVKLYRRLLMKFRDGSADYMSEIESARVDNNLESMARAAHTLKGVAGNLGVTEVYQSVLALENACKQGDDNISLLVRQVQSNMSTVIDGLEVLQVE